MKHKTLPDLLRNAELHQLTAKYLGATDEDSADYADFFERLAKKLGAERFVVPIFGLQGSGKSTLLSAILFKKRVLPVDVDETTCVPVEIVWAESPSESARIIFHDKTEKIVAAHEDELASYIHHSKNSGNKLGVSRVVLESDAELLKSGMVLVDLPGIGSLNKQNAETTNNYLKEAIGILFMLRTSPPITQTEALAIQLQWPHLHYAFFIQNRWINETETATKQGRDHNIKVLREIAEKAQVPLPAEGPDVLVVNAYKAWQSALENDFELAEKSRLNAAIEKLQSGAANWPNRLLEATKDAVGLKLQKIEQKCENSLADLSKSREQLKKDIEDESERFDSYVRKLGEKIEEEGSLVDNYKTEVRSKLAEKRMECQKELRNKMRTKMRGGIIDGPRLEKALDDELKAAFDEVLGDVHSDLSLFLKDLKERISTLEPWEGTTSFRKSTFCSEESFKYEDFLSSALGLGGAVIVAAFLASNPVGWVVGAGLLVSAALVGSFAGDKIADYLRGVKIEKQEPAVFEAIDEFVLNTFSKLERDIRECLDGIVSQLEAWKSQQELAFLREKRVRMETLRADDAEKQAKAGNIRKDLEQARWFQTQLKSL